MSDGCSCGMSCGGKSVELGVTSREYLEGLIDKNFDSVRRYSVEKLADIFSQTMGWKGNFSRQDTDWYFSENVIDGRGPDAVRASAEKLSVLCASTKFLGAENAELLPEDDFHVIHNGSKPFWIGYKEILGALPDNRVLYYLAEGDKIFHEKMDLFLGRDIFTLSQNSRGRMREFSSEYSGILFA